MSTHRFDADRRPGEMILLVHPDVLFELGEAAFDNYVTRTTPFFRNQTIFVHWFYSDEFPRILREWEDNRDTDRTRLFARVRGHFERLADVARWDGGKYGATFNNELADWVIEHPGGLVRVGGGYEDLCVKETMKQLELHPVVGVMKETGVRAVVVPRFCFRRAQA